MNVSEERLRWRRWQVDDTHDRLQKLIVKLQETLPTWAQETKNKYNTISFTSFLIKNLPQAPEFFGEALMRQYQQNPAYYQDYYGSRFVPFLKMKEKGTFVCRYARNYYRSMPYQNYGPAYGGGCPTPCWNAGTPASLTALHFCTCFHFHAILFHSHILHKALFIIK